MVQNISSSTPLFIHSSPSFEQKEESDSARTASFQKCQNTPSLASLEQRKSQTWNTDLTGRSGGKWDIPGLQASNFQSSHPVLNEVYRGLNNSFGLAASVINHTNNLAGTLLELPSHLENFITKHGGPNFDEMAIAAQMSTPGMPVDDVLAYGFEKLNEYTRNLVFKLNAKQMIPDLKNLDSHALVSMQKRNWTLEQIEDAIQYGKKYPAVDLTNNRSHAIRYIHPITKKSVVVNVETGKIIHLGGDGFKYQ